MKKFFTLFAASVIAIAANAGSTSAKFGSANNSEKDTQVTCPGFTIDGTYVAGGNSKVDVYGGDKGMKMRANKTDNTLILTVDENTTITSLVMGVVTNDTVQTLPIVDVLVDGESITLDYPIATYNTINANGTAVINLTDIEATKTIGIKFNTSDYTAKNVQVFIAGEVTYSDGASDESNVLWKSETAEGVLVDWGQAAFYLSPEEAAEKIKAGDMVTMTVSGVTEGGWPQVCIFKDTQGNYGEIIQNAGVGGKEYPYVVSFSITPSIAADIAETGISFGGNGAYVSAVGLEKGSIEVDPNAVWFGPKTLNWGDGIGIQASVFENLKVGDKLVAVYDKASENTTLQIILGAWNGENEGPNVATYQASAAHDFMTIDDEAGTITIEFIEALSNLTWGEEPKEYDVFATVKASGVQMQGPGIILNQVLYIQGEGSGEPVYPKTLDFTLNGEKELEGVTVNQELESWGGYESLQITIEGECDADNITLDFTTPEGWDYAMWDLTIGGSMTPWTTRSDEDNWYDVSDALELGYKQGNSIEIPVNGRTNWATIYLVKGDKVWGSSIDITSTVSKAGGSSNDEPLIPESINVTTFVEGLTVDQEKDSDDGSIYLGITGTIAEEEFSIVLDVPEGWDGFVSKPYFGADVTIEEYSVVPKKISATDHDWDSLEVYLADGYEKGNKLTFKPTGNYEFVETFLYKGDQVDYNAYIGITSLVSKALYNVTTSCPDLRVSQEDYDGIGIITVVGECPDDEYTVTVEVPEGYDGFVGYTDLDMAGEIDPLKKILDPEWEPLENVLASGCKITNTLTFPADGEEHYGQLMPYKGDQVDVINQINIEVLVTKAGAGGDPEFPRELDITTDAEGVEITEYIDWNCFTVGINGESATPTFDVNINVPAGWDGFVILPWTDNVKVNESLINPRKAPKAIDETWQPAKYAWSSIDEYLSAGYTKGNSFTVTASGDIDMVAYLYKGDKVEAANAIYFEGSVTCNGGSTLPKFPEIFDITPDNWDVEIWQGGVEDMSISGVELTEDEQMIVGMMYPQSAVVFYGQTDKETFSATFDLPAGWAGILPIKVSITPYTEDVEDLATRGNEPEFAPLDEYMASFMHMTSWFDVTAVEPGNPLVFPANGEKQVYICNLYIYDDGTMAGDPEFAGNYVDINNSFVIVVDVKSTATGVESIDAIDANANYYDINGNKVAKPAKGIYVKVVDGKASKVVVK